MVMDIEFSPYDDISYHSLEMKNGVRCVIVRPFNDVKTGYIQRDLQDIFDKLEISAVENVRVCDLETTTIPYKCKGEEKKIIAIYVLNAYFQGPVVRVKNVPLIYSNACILVGDKFTDLSLEQCYALVKSAKVMTIDKMISVSVNITDDMDLTPRIILEDNDGN